jgi:hypothetical protein
MNTIHYECNTANCLLYSYLALANTPVEHPVEIVQYVLAIINNPLELHVTTILVEPAEPSP